jgi:hypothetical protein
MIMGVSKASLRGLPIDQRIERMQKANMQKTVRVTPVNDVMRNVLAHPRAGHFPAEGSMEWPDDGFTLRRIQDGDVTVEKTEGEGEPHEGEHPHEGEPHHDDENGGEHHEGKGHRRSASAKGQSSGNG